MAAAGLGAVAIATTAVLASGALSGNSKRPIAAFGSGSASAGARSAGGSATPGSPTTCDHRPEVKIAAPSGFLPVLQEVAERSCVTAAIVASDGSGGARLLATHQVDVWIADSRTRGYLAGPAIAAAAPSVASSPVVLTASPQRAAALRARFGGPVPLRALFAAGGLAPSIQIEDPTKSSVALALAAPLQPLATAVTKDSNIGLALVARTLATMSSVNPDLASATVPATAVRISQERLVRPDLARPATAGEIVPTSDALPALDYPWLAGGTNPAGARAMLVALRGAVGQQARAAHAFRSPGEQSFLVGTARQAVAATPRIAQIPLLYALADSGGKRGNTLALVDVSGSMGNAVSPGGPSLIAAAGQSLQTMLPLLSDQTSVGLWQFGSRLNGELDYQPLLDLAPLARNRAALVAAGRTLRARDTGTALYNSVLAAYRSMQSHYNPAASNIIGVFTDGRNEDAPGLDLAGLQAQLRRLQDPKRPVAVLFFGYGDADIAAMNAIVAVTGGGVFPISAPSEIITAFMTATAQSVMASQR
jgi:hypothetical protein